jgi:hypothetical protein
LGKMSNPGPQSSVLMSAVRGGPSQNNPRVLVGTMARPGESDQDFLARMEAEEAAAFAAAVLEWRSEKAAGRGSATVVESGGAFVAEQHQTEDTTKAAAAAETADGVAVPATDTAPSG